MMSDNSAEIAALIESCRGRDLDAHYLAFFECFNRQWYYEAHEVLEEVWHPRRPKPGHLFYKGLIQLAGAFVHVQKGRPGPAVALLKLARTNLRPFAPVHERLDVTQVLKLVEAWLQLLANGELAPNQLTAANAPQIHLLPAV